MDHWCNVVSRPSYLHDTTYGKMVFVLKYRKEMMEMFSCLAVIWLHTQLTVQWSHMNIELSLIGKKGLFVKEETIKRKLSKIYIIDLWWGEFTSDEWTPSTNRPVIEEEFLCHDIMKESPQCNSGVQVFNQNKILWCLISISSEHRTNNIEFLGNG